MRPPSQVSLSRCMHHSIGGTGTPPLRARRRQGCAPCNGARSTHQNHHHCTPGVESTRERWRPVLAARIQHGCAHADAPRGGCVAAAARRTPPPIPPPPLIDPLRVRAGRLQRGDNVSCPARADAHSRLHALRLPCTCAPMSRMRPSSSASAATCARHTLRRHCPTHITSALPGAPWPQCAAHHTQRGHCRTQCAPRPAQAAREREGEREREGGREGGREREGGRAREREGGREGGREREHNAQHTPHKHNAQHANHKHNTQHRTHRAARAARTAMPSALAGT